MAGLLSLRAKGSTRVRSVDNTAKPKTEDYPDDLKRVVVAPLSRDRGGPTRPRPDRPTSAPGLPEASRIFVMVDEYFVRSQETLFGDAPHRENAKERARTSIVNAVEA